MVVVGQVEQPGARSFQAREGGHPGHCPVQQVLLRRGRGGRAGQDVLQGRKQEAERAVVGAIRESSGGVQGHGYKPGLPNVPRGHVHVRAAQAGAECLLRQALGAGGRHTEPIEFHVPN